MPSRCRIAIVGGGLAGLAAAHALKTFGMQAEVFESAPALGEIGAAVNASPQAVKALQAIGVGESVAAVAHLSRGIYTRNMQSGEFLEFNDRFKAVERYGAPYYTFHRADLLNALASGLDRSTIQLGHRLTGLEERSDRVVLAFANGAHVDAEIVIGADGVRSSFVGHFMVMIIQPIPVRWCGVRCWTAVMSRRKCSADGAYSMGRAGLSLHRLLYPRWKSREHRHPGGYRQVG